MRSRAGTLAMFAVLMAAGCSQFLSTAAPQTGFLDKAAQINQDEIALGRIAEVHGSSEAVRQYGRWLVRDQHQAQATLEHLSRQEGAVLAPHAEPHERKAELTRFNGPQFDAALIERLLREQKDAIAILEGGLEQVRDPAGRQYAERTLPEIQDHMRIAEYLAGELGLPTSAGLSHPPRMLSAMAEH